MTRYIVPLLAGLFLVGPAAGREPGKRFAPPDLPGNVYLNYEVRGEGSCVIVALHGFGAALDSWDDIEKALGSRCRFYVPDLVGFGLSARPRGFTYTVDEQADVVSRFLEFVQRGCGAPSFVLIGHSYGGAVAMKAYGKLKDPSIVSRLILVDSLANPKRVHLPLPFKILRVKVLNRIVISVIPAHTQVRLVLNHIYFNHRAVVEGVRKYAPFLRIPGTQTALIRTIHEYGNQEAARKLSADISAIHIPTLIIWGADDPLIVPAQADDLNRSIRNSSKELVKHAGHAPQEEAPEETARLIADFLPVY